MGFRPKDKDSLLAMAEYCLEMARMHQAKRMHKTAGNYYLCADLYLSKARDYGALKTMKPYKNFGDLINV